jgi:hypothetical protein
MQVAARDGAWAGLPGNRAAVGGKARPPSVAEDRSAGLTDLMDPEEFLNDDELPVPRLTLSQLDSGRPKRVGSGAGGAAMPSNRSGRAVVAPSSLAGAKTGPGPRGVALADDNLAARFIDVDEKEADSRDAPMWPRSPGSSKRSPTQRGVVLGVGDAKLEEAARILSGASTLKLTARLVCVRRDGKRALLTVAVVGDGAGCAGLLRPVVVVTRFRLSAVRV